LFRDGLRDVPHFPIEGILFKDIAPVLAKRGALTQAVSAIDSMVAGLEAQKVLAVDARGFVLGAALADRLEAGFVMVRKPGKLPGPVHSFAYTCEYCSGRLEVTEGLREEGDRCLVIDDLLATGGTARATADFIRARGALVVGFCFMVEIVALRGRGRLYEAPVFTLFRC
jgi:adenine phosphoribosyltransferase